MDGVWERQIRTARRILNTLLREHGSRLDDESLQILMCKVESIIKSRPLTVISSDVKNPYPLSPNQILTMKTSIVLPPPGKFQRNDVYMRVVALASCSVPSSRLRPGSLQIPQNFKGGWSNVKFFKDIPGLIN